MNVTLENLIQVVLRQYRGELYNYALTKLVYLVDLESVRRTGEQLTSIDWVRDHYGPFVWDVIECVSQRGDLFQIHHDKEKRRVVLQPHSGTGELVSDDVLSMVRAVAMESPDPNLFPENFKRYVYDTPPMVASIGDGPLDVIESVLASQEMDEFFESMADNEEFHEAMRYLAAN